jgi:hypothetical protein
MYHLEYVWASNSRLFHLVKGNSYVTRPSHYNPGRIYATCMCPVTLYYIYFYNESPLICQDLTLLSTELEAPDCVAFQGAIFWKKIYLKQNPFRCRRNFYGVFVCKNGQFCELQLRYSNSTSSKYIVVSSYYLIFTVRENLFKKCCSFQSLILKYHWLNDTNSYWSNIDEWH